MLGIPFFLDNVDSMQHRLSWLLTCQVMTSIARCCVGSRSTVFCFDASSIFLRVIFKCSFFFFPALVRFGPPFLMLEDRGISWEQLQQRILTKLYYLMLNRSQAQVNAISFSRYWSTRLTEARKQVRWSFDDSGLSPNLNAGLWFVHIKENRITREECDWAGWLIKKI